MLELTYVALGLLLAVSAHIILYQRRTIVSLRAVIELERDMRYAMDPEGWTAFGSNVAPSVPLRDRGIGAATSLQVKNDGLWVLLEGQGPFKLWPNKHPQLGIDVSGAGKRTWERLSGRTWGSTSAADYPPDRDQT